MAGSDKGRCPTCGGPVLQTGKSKVSEDLKSLLRMNPEEGFDIEVLNSIEMTALGTEIRGDARLAREVLRTVDSVLPRVRSETESTALVRPVLRDKTLDWYRTSPTDPTWTDKVPSRWGGIFFESRVPWGRLVPKLTARLARLHMESARASGLPSRFNGLFRHNLTSVGKTLRGMANSLRHLTSLDSLRQGPQQPPPYAMPIMPRVAQAYLDDLAGSARVGNEPLGLERLSELARHVGCPEVNLTLGELFPRDGDGPVVVLDGRIHPDVQTVTVFAPPPSAAGNEVLYDLVQSPPAPRESLRPNADAAGAGFVTPWEQDAVTRDEWKELLGALQKRKSKLDPPPIDSFRDRESYLRLRELILADREACKSFLAVPWKGKPSGLRLLAELLSTGTFEAHIETDGDYLEAELSDIESGDPESRPKDGQWDIGEGWKVSVEVAGGNVRTYRADRGTTAASTPGPALVSSNVQVP